MASRVLFPGPPTKTGELSKAICRTVELALSYFTVDDLLYKQLLFSSMIFH